MLVIEFVHRCTPGVKVAYGFNPGTHYIPITPRDLDKVRGMKPDVVLGLELLDRETLAVVMALLHLKEIRSVKV